MSKRILFILLALAMIPAMLFMNFDNVAVADDGVIDAIEEESDSEDKVEAFPQIVQWGLPLEDVGFRVWIDEEKGEFKDVSYKWMWDPKYEDDLILNTLEEQWFSAVECKIIDGKKEIIIDGESCEVMIEVKPRVPVGGVSYELRAFQGSTLGSLIPQLGTPKDINGAPLKGNWSWKHSKGYNMSNDTVLNGAVGEIKKYVAVFTPTDPNYSARSYNITIEMISSVSDTAFVVDTNPVADLTGKESWGQQITEAGHTRYVASDGTVSAEVTGDGVIWLREEAGGSDPWYGLDISDDQFKEGSRFWVKWINKEEDTAKWNTYYQSLNKGSENKIDKDKLNIFLTGVTSPEGKEYTNISGTANMYIQQGEGWDKDNVKAMFIGTDNKSNEPVEVGYNEGMGSPVGESDFAVLKLKHFSPYAFYEEKSSIEVVTQTQNEKGGSYWTIVILGGIVALGIIATVIILKRRKA